MGENSEAKNKVRNMSTNLRDLEEMTNFHLEFTVWKFQVFSVTRIHVKSILEILQVQTLPLLQF